MKCNVLIDWLTFTVKNVDDPYKVISWYLGLDGNLFQERGYGLNGYHNVLYFNDINVCYSPRDDEQFRDMGICVTMSGKGCRTFETMSRMNLDGNTDRQGTPSTAFPALFQLLDCNEDCNVTRIDVACDDHDGILDMDDLVEKVTSEEVNSRIMKRTVTFSLDGQTKIGTTIYLGAPSSEFRVRIYDKAKEQGDFQSHWIRVELVLKHENANAFVSNFVNCRTIGSLAAGIINDKFSFIERDSTNISRCSVCGWWLEFVGSIEAVHLLTREAVTHSIDQLEDWVICQLAPTLGMLAEAKGSVCLWNIVKAGKKKLSGKQLALVRDYKNLGDCRA